MQNYIAEFLGTLFFSFIILITNNPWAIGAALAIAIIIGTKHNNVHLNPAVTIMLTIAGKHPIHEVVPYIMSEVAGAIVALEIYKHVTM